MVQSRALKHRRGQSLVEFAIIAPVLLLIIFAILDLGRAVYAYSVVANCAREGARYGAVHPTGDIVAVVRNAAVGLDKVYLSVSAGPGSEPDTIQVDVTYLFHPITPVITNILHGNLPLSSSSSMYTGY